MEVGKTLFIIYVLEKDHNFILNIINNTETICLKSLI